MFGDNWVTPDPLFDPAGSEGPPADAVDVQFRMPRSLALHVADLIAQGRRHELLAIQHAYELAVTDTVTALQRFAGYVDEPDDFPRRRLHATSSPARLAITPVIEPHIPAVEGWHPHAHLYVGATAIRIPDGERRPIALGHLEQAVSDPWGSHLRKLWTRTEELGLRWENYPTPDDPHQVVDPPLANRIGDDPPPVCPGQHGPRRLVLADGPDFAYRDQRRRERATGAMTAVEPD